MGVADQMKLSKGKREALEIAEDARQTQWQHPSFVADLFMGRVRDSLIFPFPEQPADDRKIGDAFLGKLERFLIERIDPDEIDRTGEIPTDVIKGLVFSGGQAWEKAMSFPRLRRKPAL